MRTSHETISRQVRRYLHMNSMPQANLGRAIGLTQSQVSARLRGATKWTIDDVDNLAELGVPVCVAASPLEAWS